MYRLPRALTLRQACPSPYPSLPTRHSPYAFRIPRKQIQRRWRSHLVSRDTGEPVRMQSVRFKKPPTFSTRRLFTWALYTGAVYAYLSLLLRQLDVEIEFVEDTEDELSQQQRDAEQQEEGAVDEIAGPLYADAESTFIPLTWSTKVPRSFYRGSDPEWQEFIRIAKDAPRHKRIQNELVQIVYAGCVQHPAISRQIGSEAKVGKYWLDISFPDGPPPEFERRGIEIGEGYIAWSTQKVDADQQWRVQRALLPTAAAEGVWKTCKVLAGIQWRRFKQRLGLEGVDPLSPEERYRIALEMQRQQQGGGGGSRQKGGDGREVSKTHAEPGALVGSDATNPASSSSPTPQNQPSRSSTTTTTSSSDANARKDLPWHIPTVPLPTTSTALSSSSTDSSSSSSSSSTTTNPSDIPIAIHVFSHTLSKSWNPQKSEPPRGAFVVQGLVEVRGSKGRMLFDVQSAYDPKAAPGGKFVSVNAGVRGYKRWRQSPRGGP